MNNSKITIAQAQAQADASRSQMPPLTSMAKKYAANVLQVTRQRTEERVVELPNGQRVKIVRTYSMVR